MSSAPPESAPPPSRRQPRPAPWTRGSQFERRSIRIGIVGTIVIHLLLLWLAPKFESRFMGSGLTMVPPGADPARNFDIELSAEDFLQPPPPPHRFVEVNPDAPDNPPDQTDNFGARNQQLAQETPDPNNRGDMPSTEGKEEINSTAIVSGTRSEPTPPVEAPPPAPTNQTEPNEATEAAATPQLAQDPLPGYEKIEGDSPEGIGSNVVKLPENAQPDPNATEQIEGVRDPAEARLDGRGLYFRPDPSRPQPRPQLAQSQIRPTIMANRVDGTSNMGVRAHSALKTTYGEYLNRVIEVVDAEWNRTIQEKLSRRFSFPITGSKVEVTFLLEKSGKVVISKVDGNAGQLWDSVAVEAIAAPARYSEGYGKWSDDMIAILGDRQELVFTFFY
jgi:hypothetical protein